LDSAIGDAATAAASELANYKGEYDCYKGLGGQGPAVAQACDQLFGDLLRFWRRTGYDKQVAEREEKIKAGVDPKELGPAPDIRKPHGYVRPEDAADHIAVLGSSDDMLEERFHFQVFFKLMSELAPGLLKLHLDSRRRTHKAGSGQRDARVVVDGEYLVGNQLRDQRRLLAVRGVLAHLIQMDGPCSMPNLQLCCGILDATKGRWGSETVAVGAAFTNFKVNRAKLNCYSHEYRLRFVPSLLEPVNIFHLNMFIFPFTFHQFLLGKIKPLPSCAGVC
jgi:hypothetical protein